MPRSLSILCPHCRRKLRITDPQLLGKKVTCPGCSESFVMQPVSASAPTRMDLEQHVPGNKPPSPVAPPTEPYLSGVKPSSAPRPPSEGPGESAAAVPLVDPEAAPSAHRELQRIKAARRRRNRRTAVWGVALGLFAAAGVWSLLLLAESEFRKTRLSDAAPPADTDSADPIADRAHTAAELRANPELVEQFRPTNGQPVSLLMMPSGVNLVIHFHPALLWSEQAEYRVLRASLTEEVSAWLDGQLLVVTGFPAASISELTIGVILGPTGAPPQATWVVRLARPIGAEELLLRFGGAPSASVTPDARDKVRVQGTRGIYAHDDRTFVLAPAELIAEPPQWASVANYEATEGLLQLLQNTDGDRLLTVVGNAADVRRHVASLSPPPALPLLANALEWIGEDVETFGWSLHPAPWLHAELLLRPVTTANSQEVLQNLEDRLARLPVTMWKDVSVQLHPREVRSRQFVGRLPAMLEAWRQSTVGHTQRRFVRTVTVLPAKAAPNLVLATLFTLNELADADGPTAIANTPESPRAPALPATVAGRLELPVEVEFNRTPLEQAVQYLCGEIQVKLEIDGDALRDAGYTRNMPQTFNLGRVPAREAFKKILEQYQEPGKEMVISVDEQSLTITLLTKKFAEATGLPVYEVRGER